MAYRKHYGAVSPPAPAPMDENDAVLGPPHQPTQTQTQEQEFDRSMCYDGRPLVQSLLYLAGRISALPDWDKCTSGQFFIKRDQGRDQGMAFLRYLVEGRVAHYKGRIRDEAPCYMQAYKDVEGVINALYPMAPEPILKIVAVSVPRKHFLGGLPLRTREDDAFLGRPRPYTTLADGRAQAESVAKRGWDRDKCLSDHRFTLGFSHRPATRAGEGRTAEFVIFLPSSAGEEERALSWATLAPVADPGVDGKPDFFALLAQVRRGGQHGILLDADNDEENEEQAEEQPAEGKTPSPVPTTALQPSGGSGGGRRRTRAAASAPTASSPSAKPGAAAAALSSPFPTFPLPLARPPTWGADASSDEEEEEEVVENDEDEEEGEDSDAASVASLPPKKRHRASGAAEGGADGGAKGKGKKAPRVVLVVRSPSAASASAANVMAATAVPSPPAAKGKGGKKSGGAAAAAAAVPAAPVVVAVAATAAASTSSGGKEGGGAKKGKGATTEARSSGTSTSFIKSLMTPQLYQALWDFMSGRETNRGVRPSENTVTTYLCGIRVFLDRPGVVPLPSPKLASKKELKKYLIMHGSGFFGQWAKRGFKTVSALNQLLEFAGLYMKHRKPIGTDDEEKICLYSDDAKLPQHLVADFTVAKPKPPQAKAPTAAAATDASQGAPHPAAGGKMKRRRAGKKEEDGDDTAAGATAGAGGSSLERLHALAFAAAMCSPLRGPPKPRKLARGLGPYADSDYSSSSGSSGSGSEMEEEGGDGGDGGDGDDGDDGLWWGEGGMDDDRVVVMLAGKGVGGVGIGGGIPQTPVGVCKPEAMEI